MRTQSLTEIHVINNANFLPRQFDILLLPLHDSLNFIFNCLTEIDKLISDRAQQLAGHVVNWIDKDVPL